MGEVRESQKERVFKTVIRLLGEKYDPARDMAVYFHPINSLKETELTPPPGYDELRPIDEGGEETYRDTKTFECPVRGTVTETVIIKRLKPQLTPEQEKMRALVNAYNQNKHLRELQISDFKTTFGWPFRENPLLQELIELSGVPRNAVFDALRRDPRLNGGKKRCWSAKRKPSWDEIIARKEEVDQKEVISTLKSDGYAEDEINYIVFGKNKRRSA